MLLSAVPEAALAGQWYRCKLTGKTRETSCCHKTAAAEREAPRAEVTRTPCCDLVRNEPRAVTARTESRTELRAPIPYADVALVAAISIETPSSYARVPFERATAPPPPGGPIYIRHSSFLL
jgi:hypothetical protein